MVRGRLIRRYKRFLADVEIECGQVVTALCPNSGSMLGCLEEGAPVCLSPADNPKRKTRYTWEMIYIDGGWVGINTGVPNKLIALAARQRRLPIFHDARSVKTEVKTGEHTRLDLAVELDGAGRMFVEVKNVTLVRGGEAHFPDAQTERGRKHLRELMRLYDEGHRAAMVYVVQRGDARAFGPAQDIDPAYADLYYEAGRRGVEVVAVVAEVRPEWIGLRRELPLTEFLSQ